MIQSHRLQLAFYWRLGKPYPRYIITGDEWFCAELDELSEFLEGTGLTTIYPEQDLLWLGWGEETERFKTLENFEKEFSSLARWEATRYAVLEWYFPIDDGRATSYDLFLFDCRTGQPLTGPDCKPVPGREAEVERLRRGIEPMMRGESFSFM